METMTEREQQHRERFGLACAAKYEYLANRFSGRGIVICGGGTKYLPCAWVCINMLRKLGCALPIELWHLGDDEMDDATRAFLQPLGVTTVDGRALLSEYPSRILNGWELKCYALLHCSFQEVLLLDADNVPAVDPTFLFTSEEYARHGAIFWPDIGRHPPFQPVWHIAGVEYRDEPEIESGQIVVDKRRCWRALNVAMHLRAPLKTHLLLTSL